MVISRCTRVVLLMLCCAAFSLAQTNLITNGSFEGPAVPAGSAPVVTTGSPDGWTAYFNKYEYWNNFQGYGAADGNQFIELDTVPGTPDQIYQAFDTTPGTTYDVYFAFKGRDLVGFANNGVLVWAGPDGVPATQLGMVSGGTNNWVEHHYTFTATTSKSRLTFTEFWDDGGGDWIDNVRVYAQDAPAVPEPGTIAMVLGGLALIAFRVRK